MEGCKASGPWGQKMAGYQTNAPWPLGFRCTQKARRLATPGLERTLLSHQTGTGDAFRPEESITRRTRAGQGCSDKKSPSDLPGSEGLKVAAKAIG